MQSENIGVFAFCIATSPACICSNRTRSRSGKNAAAHRMLKYSIQMPAFLHGPLWNQMHAGDVAMQNVKSTADWYVIAKSGEYW